MPANTSPAYQAIEDAMGRIEEEIIAVAKREGVNPVRLTGTMWVDAEAGRLWYEVLDVKYGILSYVAEAPELAAHGETLIAAADLDEAEWYNRPGKDD